MVGNHQTSIYKWLFGVPGLSYYLPGSYTSQVVQNFFNVLGKTSLEFSCFWLINDTSSVIAVKGRMWIQFYTIYRK